MASINTSRPLEMVLISLSLIVLVLRTAPCDGQPLGISMTDDEYSVQLNKKPLFSGRGVAMFAGGSWHASDAPSTATDKLIMEGQNPCMGVDAIGSFSGICTSWKSSLDSQLQLQTSIKVYDSGTAVSFTYNITGAALTGTQSDNATNVITNFPALSIAQDSFLNNASFLSWRGTFSGAQRDPRSSTGTTSGPHVYVNANALVDHADVVVLSYFDHFMSSSQTNEKYNGDHVDWLPGISQSVLGLPTNFSQTFLLHYGDKGVTGTLFDWGQLMQSSHAQPGGFRKLPDITLEKIGYQTDNGAMYCFCSKDCATTLLDEKKYLDSIGVDIGYLSHQGDWWMGTGGGAPWCIGEWIPNSRYDIMTVAEFQQKLGVPIQLYAPYFCNGTQYAKSNGGNFTMVQSNNSLPGCKMFVFKDAAPDTAYDFYTWLFHYGKAMGMVSFEPDFLNQNYNCMPAFRESPAAIESWMHGLDRAAVESQIPQQWCMATPTNVLASLDLPSVTNFRASNDFYYGGSFNIGESSFLMWALGVAPSKDTFWSTDNSPLGPELGGCDRKRGCPPDHSNSSCELHTILAILSMGPVGFSDAIGKSNASLLMRTCRQDGTLLKPSKSVTAVNAVFSAQNSPPGNVYMTYCGSMEQSTAYIIVSFSMKDTWSLTVMDLWPPVNFDHSAVQGAEKAAIAVSTTTFVYRMRWNQPVCSHNQSAEACVSSVSFPSDLKADGDNKILDVPARVSQESDLTPCLTMVWPVLCPSGWLLLGELGKYVPLSAQRFPSQYACITEGISFDVVGSPDESVTVTALRPSPDGTPASYAVVSDITVPNSGKITIKLNE
eukprot:scpid44594/ scgid17018/ 